MRLAVSIWQDIFDRAAHLVPPRGGDRRGLGLASLANDRPATGGFLTTDRRGVTRTAKGADHMPSCATCSASLRDAAKFCTQCGATVVAERVTADARETVPIEPVQLPAVEPAVDTQVEQTHTAEGEWAAEPVPVPARIVPQRRTVRVLARSTSATWALVAGVAPLAVSITGNLLSSQLGIAALARVEAGDAQGAWAPVLTVLALVFVGNAALLTVCAIMGVRGLRETANGITRGRALAVAGLSAGGVNLVLWVAGLVVTVSGLNAVLV